MDKSEMRSLILVATGSICFIILMSTFCYLLVQGSKSTVTVSEPVATQPAPVVTTPVPVVAPTPSPTPLYPATITFTAYVANAPHMGAANVLDRQFTVQTTENIVLVFRNYEEWNPILPGQTYTCSVYGNQEGYGTIYKVDNCYLNRYSDIVPVLRNSYWSPYDWDTSDWYYNDRFYNERYRYCNEHGCWINDHEFVTKETDNMFYKYYHHDHTYWRCYGNYQCTEIPVSKVPAYVDVIERDPVFEEMHYLF